MKKSRSMLFLGAMALGASAQEQRCDDQGTPSCNFIQAEDTLFANGFDPLPPDLDFDNDGLKNGVETGTNVFLSATNTGTSPYMADTDGDGLFDGDEVLGTAGGLNLPALGVNPLRKDFLMEYDWFEDSQGGYHSHRPTPAVLNGVAAMLAAAPVRNPDGTTGIHAIQDIGQGGLFTGGNIIASSNGNLAGDAAGTAFSAVIAQHFTPKRRRYFHYILMVHHYNSGTTNSSGSAGLLSYKAIISMGSAFNNPDYTRNTILHEMGHNLGLDHGGNETCNVKPNYNSIMNYLYQFQGVDTTCDGTPDGLAAFSEGSRLTLNEAGLDETRGLCAAPRVPLDWNRNGLLETQVAVDLNPIGAGGCSPTFSVLQDHNDWAAVRFVGLYLASQQPLEREWDVIAPECPSPPAPPPHGHRMNR